MVSAALLVAETRLTRMIPAGRAPIVYRSPILEGTGSSGELDGSLELSAGSIDIAAARTADESRDPSIDEYSLKLCDLFFFRRPELNTRPRIQRDQIQLGSNTANQFNDLTCIPFGVVLAREQDVFEGNSLARAQGKSASGLG